MDLSVASTQDPGAYPASWTRQCSSGHATAPVTRRSQLTLNHTRHRHNDSSYFYYFLIVFLSNNNNRFYFPSLPLNSLSLPVSFQSGIILQNYRFNIVSASKEIFYILLQQLNWFCPSLSYCRLATDYSSVDSSIFLFIFYIPRLL